MRHLILVFFLLVFFSTHLKAQTLTVVNTSFDDDRFNHGSKTSVTKNDSLLYF